MIEEQSNKIILKIVENRQYSTFLRIFREHLHPGTIIISDGFSSYKKAVRDFGSEHIVVNHSIGFKNCDGFTTNNIENLWNLLKYEVKRRRGVKFSFAQKFIEEFVFRYRFLKRPNQLDVINCFRGVVEYLFGD